MPILNDQEFTIFIIMVLANKFCCVNISTTSWRRWRVSSTGQGGISNWR